ncbi:glycosyltransferase [Myxococcota bacterium]|nr:glycosyltransferase [Myxococcota bacterium]
MEPTTFALFRNNFLPLSETFIHDELRFHERYTGVVFARRHLNADVFPGHEVHAADGAGANSPASLLYGATGLYAPFFREFFTRRFALVHAHFGHNGLYALPYAVAARLPLVVTVHGRDVTILTGPDRHKPEFWYYSLRARQLFARTNLFLAASTELAELLVEAGCDPEKIRIHRLGVDLSNFAFRESEPEENGSAQTPQVLMVGRFVKKKGFHYGLRAFAAALSSGVSARCRLIGDGPERGALEQLVRDLGIADRVVFSGSVPHAAVREAMNESALLLAPSMVAPNMDRESGLIVAKEAAAVGLPVVAHWHGGLPDIVDDGVTGFLVPERDLGRLTDRLSRLLGDRQLRVGFGRAAREKMERDYDIRIANRRLEGFYDEVLSGWTRR